MRTRHHFGPRRGYRSYATHSFNFMGEDFIAEIDYVITAEGARPTWDDTGWSPEFDIESIHLYQDFPSYRPVTGDGPRFKATGKLFEVLSQDSDLKATIYDDLWHNYEDEEDY